MRNVHVFGGIAVIASAVIFATPHPHARSANVSPQSLLPTPGIYTIDPDHSFTYFGALHHVVGLVRGRFDHVTGSITSSADPTQCAVDITIAAYTVSTQNSDRDTDLRGPDYFDVDRFPLITYRGKGVHRSADGQSWVLDGELKIRNHTKIVPITFAFNGVFPDTKPGRPDRAAFHATAGARRNDFGITKYTLTEVGPNPSGPDVQIELDVEADAANPKPSA